MESTCNNTHLFKSKKVRQEFRREQILESVYAYLAVFVVKPIRIGIKTVFWFLTFKWLDQEKDNKIYAGIVRKTCRRMGIDDYYPVLLRDAETCSTCGKLLKMLVQPEHECFLCWRIHMQDTHGLILVVSGERPELLLTEQIRTNFQKGWQHAGFEDSGGRDPVSASDRNRPY